MTIVLHGCRVVRLAVVAGGLGVGAMLLSGGRQAWAVGVQAVQDATKTSATDAPATNAKDETRFEAERPLPDISTLMHEVEAHQCIAETVRKDYLYHAFERAEQLDGHGVVKKATTREYDVFWVNGVPVQKLLKKDGKELSPEEQKKEDERIDKEAAKEQKLREKGDAEGKATDPRGNEEITVSRFLGLGSFTNPRRVKVNGRDTIAVDYAGDPKAKTRNREEGVVRDLVGTVWVDEQDQTISKVEGHFLNAFKIGGGLVMNIRKDTNFKFAQKKVNDEVWLPTGFEGKGAVRALLLLNFDGNVRVEMSDYRKFKATATILPGVSAMEETGSSPQ
jgi:hypothetical protein